MASSAGFVAYVAEQLQGAGVITYRKMFGEYGFYCNGKFFACVCDNQLFVKITEAGGELLKDPQTAPPYEGAKPYFLITDLEDRERLHRLAAVTCAALPEPKPKKERRK